jgi:hypothetical protein
MCQFNLSILSKGSPSFTQLGLTREEGRDGGASVEHYYHANKFKKNTPNYYKKFAIDSGSAFAFEPKKALGAGGKGEKLERKTPKLKR